MIYINISPKFRLMSIHFTSFNVFLRKITHFRYKDFAEEGKKKPISQRAVKKRPILLKINFFKIDLMYGIFIKFAHFTGSNPSGLKNRPFWFIGNTHQTFTLKIPKTLDSSRVFGERF